LFEWPEAVWKAVTGTSRLSLLLEVLFLADFFFEFLLAIPILTAQSSGYLDSDPGTGIRDGVACVQDDGPLVSVTVSCRALYAMVAAKLRSGNIHLSRFRNDHSFRKPRVWRTGELTAGYVSCLVDQ
jgi:hypothetical protein